MTEIPLYADLASPWSLPIGALVRVPGDGVLRRSDRARPWSSITTEHFYDGQPAAFQDRISEFTVTFEGGCPSAMKGFETPLGTMPPFAPSLFEKPGITVIDQYSKLDDPMTARRAAHNERIKGRIKALHGWQVDGTGDGRSKPRPMGASWLDCFQWLEGGPFSNTYKIVVKTPFID